MLNPEMNRFLVKVVAFAGVLAFIFVVLGALMYQVEKRAYYRGIRLSAADKFVAIGDSRSMQNLNPRFIKGLKNLALGGSRIAVWDHKLKDVIDLNRQDGIERTILVEFEPTQFVSARARKIRDFERKWAFFWRLHPELMTEIHYDNWIRGYLKAEFPASFLAWVVSGLTGKPYFLRMINGFGAPPAKSGYTDEEKEKMLLVRNESLCNYRFSKEDCAWLDRFKRRVDEVGWRFVVFTFPICGEEHVRPAVQSLTKGVSSWCAQNAVEYYDLSDSLQAKDMWLDTAHLLLGGAERLWPKIAMCLSGSSSGQD